jgi:hypothetical protein
VSADPIIYCLEHLTDYRQFERLCSDVMAGSGYRNIEPIGGSNDRGRDALFKSEDSLTVFAYSVRSDWRAKLEQDCARIHEEEHNPTSIVFACTTSLSGSERDSTKAEVHARYGWQIEIYDLERLRVALASAQRHLVAQHPAIFCPPFFPQRGGLSISASADTLVIDHVDADHAVATWLDRKLSMLGFQTWCKGTAPLAGENIDDTIRTLIEKRAVQYLPFLSRESLSHQAFKDRCAIAGAREGLLLPCWADPVDAFLPGSRLVRIAPASFVENWAIGLNAVHQRLQANAIAPKFGLEQGRNIAIRANVPEPVIKSAPERVFANVFKVDVPKTLLIFEPNRDLGEELRNKMRKEWAFVCASPNQWLTFHELPRTFERFFVRGRKELQWSIDEELAGRPTAHILRELIRRSLDVACHQAGLTWCPDRKIYFFQRDDGKDRKVPLRHVDGRQTHVGVTGERKLGWGERASQFRYQLGPRFRAGQDEDGTWWLTLRVYVRVTDTGGLPYQLKEIGRRRKAVTKNWWNKEWLARMLGVIQALETSEGIIQVGDDKTALIVSTDPLQWECPVSIDTEAMTRYEDFQREIAAARAIEEDDDDSIVDYPSNPLEDGQDG